MWFTQNIHGPMNHGENIYLVWLYVIDNSIGTFDNLTNLLNIKFRNDTT